MVSGLQFFYAAFALIAVERVSSFLSRPVLRIACVTVLVVAVAFVPNVIRAPEVFAAQQGLGRAVNLAHTIARAGNVYFIATYDWDRNARAITSREAFDRLGSDAVIVTDYPIFYHVKYPDLFALFHDTKPVASYPTEWCTREVWNELRTYFAFRRWFMEPMNCEAQVYRVSDLQHEQNGKPLIISDVSADSIQSTQEGPLRAVQPHNPNFPVDENTAARAAFEDLWVSNSSDTPHWLQITFARPAVIGSVTIVPADFHVPPYNYWFGRQRDSDVEIDVTSTHNGPWHAVWRRSALQYLAVFSADFPTQRVAELRVVIRQDGSNSNYAAGIENITFPGFSLRER